MLSASFTSMFKPPSSDEDDDNNTLGANPSFHRFDSRLPVPSGSGHRHVSGYGHSAGYTSTPLPCGGTFTLASDSKRASSSALGTPPANDEERGLQPGDEEVDMGLEADDEAEGKKETPGDELLINPKEVELLNEIINPVIDDQAPTVPKSGNKWGSTHLDGGTRSSDSSGEDLDTKGVRIKKKVVMPTKALHPSQWSKEDIDIMHHIRYKTDFDRFQTYHHNKIDNSTYIKVARADPSSVIRKSVFSVAAYWETLWLKGGDISKFDKEVGTKFKKSAKISQVPDNVRVSIDRVMLVCQRENGINVAYSDSDGFRRPGSMGLWDLHSSDVLSWAKMQLSSGTIDANYCPLCAFWSTNNETLNNHVCKHYKMGLTCRANGFTTAGIAAMKAHMEAEHGYELKHTGVVKKPKGKG